MIAVANPPVAVIIKYASIHARWPTNALVIIICFHLHSSQKQKIVGPIVDVITIRLRHLLQLL